MISFQDHLDEYKEAIRLKFEVEKTKEFSSFLLNPSRALLRKLCVERFKENTNANDLKTFRLFFGFEFDNRKKLQEATDKFRPIETFLKRETDLVDVEGINMAAILVDFNPRPFTKFKNLDYENSNEDLEKDLEKDSDKYLNEVRSDEEEMVPANQSSKKKIGILILMIVSVFLVGYTSNKMFFSNDCMQWNGDHYEEVKCDNDIKGVGSFSEIVPSDAEMLGLKKISVCDTTKFFSGNKALIWYCKVNGKPEYFTSHGIHPITGKPLKPVTHYIVDKYVSSGK